MNLTIILTFRYQFSFHIIARKLKFSEYHRKQFLSRIKKTDKNVYDSNFIGHTKIPVVSGQFRTEIRSACKLLTGGHHRPL